MTPREINQKLQQYAESICRELLPAGKKQSSEWVVGSVDGEAGDSLRVHLRGTKAGIWKDFGTSEKGGDLLDLYVKTQNVPIREAIQWAKDYLGILDHKLENPTHYKKPPKPQCQSPKLGVFEYLTGERKLTKEAIEAYKIAEQGNNIVFPYLRDDELVFVKYRDINDKKKMRVESGCEPILFGWQAIPDDTRKILICEGEIDALSWWMSGFPALSVPNGANGHTWIENEYDNLDRFDEIYISFDNDKPGKEGALQIVERLGRERCKIIEVPSPWKDANDIIQTNGATGLINLPEKAKSIDPVELRHASEYTDRVIDIFTGKNLNDAGYSTPWKKVKDNFRFRPGEFTVLAGENHHGKSEGMGHITVDVISQGAVACVASLEFKPEKWIANLCRQACALDPHNITDGYAKAVEQFVRESLWAFDSFEDTSINSILKIFQYAKNKYGADFFVIDNLEMCSNSSDDYEGQRQVAQKIANFARINHVHVVLIHHMNKNNDQRNRHAIKGSGSITNLAHNVILWKRSEKKEDQVEKIAYAMKGATGQDEIDLKLQLDEVLEKPDATMEIDKQRETGIRKTFFLWFDKHSRQFLGDKDGKPKFYVSYNKQERTMGMD